MKPYGREHYRRPRKPHDEVWQKLTPAAADQLRRLLRVTALEPLARRLGSSPTTIEKANMGADLKADVAARLSAALERIA